MGSRSQSERINRHPAVEAVIAIHEQALAAHGGATWLLNRENIIITLRKLLC